MAWYGDSIKHSRCAKGIKTGRKSKRRINKRKYQPILYNSHAKRFVSYSRKRPRKSWDEMSDIEKDQCVKRKRDKEDYGHTKFYDRHKEGSTIAYVKKERYKYEIPLVDLDELMKAKSEGREPKVGVIRAGPKIVRLERGSIVDPSKFPDTFEEQKKHDKEWYEDVKIRNDIRESQGREIVTPKTNTKGGYVNRDFLEGRAAHFGVSENDIKQMTNHQLNEEVRKQEWALYKIYREKRKED